MEKRGDHNHAGVVSGDKSVAFSGDKSAAFSGDPKGSVECGVWSV